MTRLVVTGDDFGLSQTVNAAIEEAHVSGILSAASLMVAQDATQDAIERARALPGLRVGLHLVFVKGRAMSAVRDIPHLASPDGRLPEDQLRASLRLAFSSAMRRDLKREIEAQFAAFARSGLALDHVNGHCHMHLHPLILDLILKIGPAYGMRAMRIVREPRLRTGGVAGFCERNVIAIFDRWMRRKLGQAGVSHNDWLLGLSATGRMTAETLLSCLERLPDGFCEIYGHPGANAAESAAFRDPRVRQRLEALGLKPSGFTAPAGGRI